MQYFLIKGDPKEYGIDDLAQDGTAKWDGVRNYQAVNTIKQWQPGDRLYVYHSGNERAIVGLAHVASEPYPDPNDDRSWLAEITFDAKLPPEQRISLGEVKAQEEFQEFPLVKQPRLSVMSCPPAFVDWMEEQGVKWPS